MRISRVRWCSWLGPGVAIFAGLKRQLGSDILIAELQETVQPLLQLLIRRGSFADAAAMRVEAISHGGQGGQERVALLQALCTPSLDVNTARRQRII